MYHTLKDFYGDWKYESESTQKVFNALTDESLNQKVYDGGRTLGFLAWHITDTIGEMLGRTGMKVFRPDEEHFKHTSAKDLQTIYKHACDSLDEKLKANWTDETLEQSDDMYGEQWKRGGTLHVLILHQAHHRGQMTVLMRQAGLKVPGFYGPSKEEWTAYGMEPHP